MTSVPEKMTLFDTVDNINIRVHIYKDQILRSRGSVAPTQFPCYSYGGSRLNVECV